MATRNPITNDEIKSKHLSQEGKSNFDNIFGKRDWRNRPMQDEEAAKEVDVMVEK